VTSLAALTTLTTALAALLAAGWVCREAFPDPLDRIAVTAVAAAAALFGVFALGDLTAGMPAALLNLLLLLNPIVAVASAANVDLFHTPWLYSVSPIAHREFQYPAWQAAAALYGCAAATLVAARARRVARARGITTSTH
jgi:hypothetical protein